MVLRVYEIVHMYSYVMWCLLFTSYLHLLHQNTVRDIPTICISHRYHHDDDNPPHPPYALFHNHPQSSSSSCSLSLYPSRPYTSSSPSSSITVSSVLYISFSI